MFGTDCFWATNSGSSCRFGVRREKENAEADGRLEAALAERQPSGIFWHVYRCNIAIRAGFINPETEIPNTNKNKNCKKIQTQLNMNE